MRALSPNLRWSRTELLFCVQRCTQALIVVLFLCGLVWQNHALGGLSTIPLFALLPITKAYLRAVQAELSQ